MKILVLSDSHGNRRVVEKVLDKMHDSCDMVIHLGDGESDMDIVREKYPDLPIEQVAGNCDRSSMLPSTKVVEAGDVKIYLCHGHIQGVKGGLGHLRELAEMCGCTIAMFGHTHARLERYEEGFYFFNPGSVSMSHDGNPPSYGVVDISPAGILLNVVDISRN